MSDWDDNRMIWSKVALAAAAGFAALAVCSGVTAAIFALALASAFNYLTLGVVGSSLHPALFLVGAATAVLVASAGLSLPPLALGARGRHALATTLLSSLCFCVFAFAFFLSTPVALVALVTTPIVGSLGAIWEGNTIASRPLWTIVIAGSAIYCASLLAFWLVSGDVRLSVLAGMVVASSSWFLLPGVVAMHRSA